MFGVCAEAAGEERRDEGLSRLSYNVVVKILQLHARYDARTAAVILARTSHRALASSSPMIKACKRDEETSRDPQSRPYLMDGIGSTTAIPRIDSNAGPETTVAIRPSELHRQIRMKDRLVRHSDAYLAQNKRPVPFLLAFDIFVCPKGARFSDKLLIATKDKCTSKPFLHVDL